MYYRDSFTRLGKLHELPIPRLYLSATVPIRHEAAFRDKAQLHDGPILRAHTVRPELSWQLLDLRGRDVRPDQCFLVVRGLMQAMATQHFQHSSRGIIFVPTRTACQDLALALGVPDYHADLDVPTKSERLCHWRDGLQPWIVATTAFENGIDYPRVDAVIYAGWPQGLVSRDQGAGRGGRSGQPCPVFVCLYGFPSRAQGVEDYECVQELKQWADHPQQCLRIIPGQCLDGVAHQCSDNVDWQCCGSCDPYGPFAQLALTALATALAPESTTQDLYNPSPAYHDDSPPPATQGHSMALPPSVSLATVVCSISLTLTMFISPSSHLCPPFRQHLAPRGAILRPSSLSLRLPSHTRPHDTLPRILTCRLRLPKSEDMPDAVPPMRISSDRPRLLIAHLLIHLPRPLA